MNASWQGIFPALTTKFKTDLSLDLPAFERHIGVQIDAGVDGLVVLGSLGENATLSPEEKNDVIKAAIRTAAGRVPVLSCVAETSTAGACRFIEKTWASGLAGYMALPGIQYQADRRETIAHYRAVAKASVLPIMVYNNPPAYRVDITPEMFAELADEPKFVAIKESSGDVRRVTDIRNLCGDRYAIFSGVDDLAYGGFLLGAVGWVAGLVCAFPAEAVAIYRLIRAEKYEDALRLFNWFMPVLQLDSDVKFVQYIKLAESMTGLGTEWVRPPRLTLAGEERERISSIISEAIRTRPKLPAL
ncbi:MAG TPA: dihydrodipicolinate synthase family protein [Bacteroidota bacterium]|nr:dihydrodipicolinate synthase family protein [Bacteroidota bacterium]